MEIPVAMLTMRTLIPLLGAMLLAACSTTHIETKSATKSNESGSSYDYINSYQKYGLPRQSPGEPPRTATALAPDREVVGVPIPIIIPITELASVATGSSSSTPASQIVEFIPEPEIEGIPRPSPAPQRRPPSSSPGHGGTPTHTPSIEKQPPSAPHVRLAKSAFHVPTPILLKQTVVAQLRINPCKDLESMRRELEPENIKRPGILAAAQVEITDYMHAELKADETAITVKPLSPGRQKLVPCSTTPWSWNVTGLMKGDHEMIVTLLKILPNGETVAVPTEVYRLKVNVKPIDEFMERLEQFTAIIKSTTTLVVATIGLIAALGFGWARKRQGKVGT
jgi:hypothetical protein